MKKAVLTTLSMLMLILAKGQFTVDPGVWKIVTINNLTYRIFVPSDFTTGSNYYFHVAFWGDGEQNGAALSNQVPGKWLLNPYNWDGSVHMNNGSVAKFIIFGVPNYGIQPQVYANAIDSVFKVLGNKVDTANHNYFSTSGFSGGPGRMWSYLVQSTSPYRPLFQNTISMSPTGIGIDVTPRSTPGRHWVWYSSMDNNSGTPEWAALGLYQDIGSSEKKITNQTLPDSCHCAWIWDSCMSIAGVGTQNGGNAQSNRWRWLVDQNDGAVIPPAAPYPFVIGQLRQKTHGGRNFLYYIPDTAQRTTLKHYFIYNVVDSTGKDSAYAVQRGLAKKYKNGWNGKTPLCNGDTAVFTMFTQVDEPLLKSTMELGIQLALDSLPNQVFDTANARRIKNILTGIGRGATTQLTYLMNKFVSSQGTSFFRDNFGVFVSVDQHDNGHITGDGWAEIETPFKSWWWTSNTSGWPYMPFTSRTGKDSAGNRNPGAQTKITEIAANYSPITWDSAYSTAGTTSANNVFRWIIDTSDCVVNPPAGPEGPFVVGQLRQKTYGSRNFLYYIPDTAQRATLKHYFIYNIIDSTGKDSAYAVQRGLAKKYKNGWNGKQPLCNGDTAVFSMIMQLQNPHLKADMELGIQLALDSLPNHIFDTAYARRMKNVFTGIGRGPTSQLTYLMNKFIVNGQGSAAFRRNFGVFVSVDQHDNGHISSDGWTVVETPLKSWWWTSNTSGWPYMAATSRTGKDSADNRNPGQATKITELAVNYSPLTWDSAYSTTGSTSANNVFIWITDTSDCSGLMTSPSIVKEEIKQAEEIKIMGITPNPAFSVLNIGWTAREKGVTTINIVDMQGKIMHRNIVSNAKGYNRSEVYIQSLAKGAYIIQLITGREIITKKFLKM